MKVLMTPSSLISLENVRRVTKKVSESNHTTYGQKYTITHHSIVIVYVDGESEFIECGEDKNGADMCEVTFANIHDILLKE